jgi:hypothetical protein
MKRLLKFKTAPVATGLLLVAILAASCSSGSSNSSASIPLSGKSANATALLQSIESQTQKTQNIDANFSVNITNANYLFESSGNLSPAQLKKDETIVAAIPKFSISIAISKTSSAPGNENELISLDYSSQPIAQIMDTLRNSKVSAAYVKVYFANLANLPLSASVKSELGLVSGILQANWYKIPSSLIASAQSRVAGTQKLSSEIKALRNFVTNEKSLSVSILKGEFKSQVTSNQGGETITLSNNLYSILRWLDTQGLNEPGSLRSLIPSSTKSSLSTSLRQAKAHGLQKDLLTISIAATSANELNATNLSFLLVNPKNTKQKVTVSCDINYTYNTQVTPPSNAVSLPPSLLGGLSGTGL